MSSPIIQAGAQAQPQQVAEIDQHGNLYLVGVLRADQVEYIISEVTARVVAALQSKPTPPEYSDPQI